MTASRPGNSPIRVRAQPPPIWSDDVVDLLPELAATPLDRVQSVAERCKLTMALRFKRPWLAGYPRLIHVRDTTGDRSPGSGILGLKTSPVGGQTSAFEYVKRAVVDNALSRTGSLHIWAWSTPEIDELLAFVKWLRDIHNTELPPNVWLGTRIQTASDLTRVASLLQAGTQRTKHFVMLEPTLSLVDLRPHLNGIDWCIAGQSRVYGACRFDADAARQLLDACRRTRTVLFITAIGSDASPITANGGTNWYMWPTDLQIRRLPDPTFLLPGRNPEGMVRKIKSLRARALQFAEARGWRNLSLSVDNSGLQIP